MMVRDGSGDVGLWSGSRARSVNGTITFSVWDGDWAVLEEYGTSNTITQRYLQGYHGLVKTLQDNIYYYQDELGSTSHTANASGALLEYYKYDLYGKPTYWSAANSQIASSNYNVRDLGDGGARWIAELGLYDDRNRFMSPTLGRFIQPDPIGFKGDASNLYRYVGNDWANRTDPMGLTGTENVGGQDPADTGNFGALSTDPARGGGQGQSMARQQQSARGSLMGPLSGRVQTQQFRNSQEDMKGFTMGGRSPIAKFADPGRFSLEGPHSPTLSDRLKHAKEGVKDLAFGGAAIAAAAKSKNMGAIIVVGTGGAIYVVNGLSHLGAAVRANAPGPNAAAEKMFGAPNSVLGGVGRLSGGERGQAIGEIVNGGLELGFGASAIFRGEVSAAEVAHAGITDVEIHNARQDLNQEH
jgi:RHS repeat-associated protein